MKALSTITLLLSLVAARPAAAHIRSLPQLALVPSRPVVRPLTRYLAAVLHLSPRQAAAVQQALRSYPARSFAPEDLALSLSPVLAPEAQLRLQSLQSDVTTYRALCYLAARH